MATYYVSTSGSDFNTGTIDSPWLTLDKGLLSSAPGDTILARGGTYTSGLVNRDPGSAFITYGGALRTVNRYDAQGRIIEAYPGEFPRFKRFGGAFDNLTMRGIEFYDMTGMYHWHQHIKSTFEDCKFLCTAANAWTCFVFFPRYYADQPITQSSAYGNVFLRCTFSGATEEVTGGDNSFERGRTTVASNSGGITFTTGVAVCSATTVDYVLVLDGTHKGNYYRVTNVAGNIMTLDPTNFSTDIPIGSNVTYGCVTAENVWDDCNIHVFKENCHWENYGKPNPSQLYLGGFALQNVKGQMGVNAGVSFWGGCYGNHIKDCHLIGNGAPTFPANAVEELCLIGVRDAAYGTEHHATLSPQHAAQWPEESRLNSGNKVTGCDFDGVPYPLIVDNVYELLCDSDVPVWDDDMQEWSYGDAYSAAIDPDYPNFNAIINGNDFGGKRVWLIDAGDISFGEGQNAQIITSVDEAFATRAYRYIDGRYGSRNIGDPSTTTFLYGEGLYSLPRNFDFRLMSPPAPDPEPITSYGVSEAFGDSLAAVMGLALARSYGETESVGQSSASFINPAIMSSHGETEAAGLTSAGLIEGLTARKFDFRLILGTIQIAKGFLSAFMRMHRN